ncbi:uncharacterized protein hhla2a.1 isoform X2 [Danio aesculapii]|uniref:uncharacterized protein hhla2a.1 isoform X2 n=1 Tax=Danio aesculapii TaxID=1142201 RepID=UPI0024C031E4|nr:uncharacterized protein hhla2a.1 isoform X2 [Danio aesculapii]
MVKSYSHKRHESTSEVRVSCIFSEDCVLPCSFTSTGGNANVQWFQQEALVLSLPHVGQGLGNGNMQFISNSASDGNASIMLKKADKTSKGRYKCVVNNKTETYVIAMVEAPIRMISINSSESGFVQCSTRDVYPAPVVQWSSEPALAPAALQPVTRISPGVNGLFTAQSVLKLHNISLEHVYMCTITSKYETQTLTASFKPQEITGYTGQDLIIPCKAPKHLQAFSAVWTFTRANKTSDILTYDSRTHKFSSSLDHAKLQEKDKAVIGDFSLVLKKPVASEHAGIYTCAFTGPKTQHLIQTHVDITSSRQGKDSMKYNLWMLGIVIGLIVLLGIVLIIKRYRAKSKRSPEKAQEDAEMQGMNSDKAAEDPQAGMKLLTETSASHS